MSMVILVMIYGYGYVDGGDYVDDDGNDDVMMVRGMLMMIMMSMVMMMNFQNGWGNGRCSWDGVVTYRAIK